MTELVEVSTDGAVCVLTLRREAKLNALSGELEGALAAALASDDVRAAGAVVVTGAGRAFSAGADISEFRDRDPEAVMAYYAATGGVYEQFAALAQPTFSAIHGYCLGGGLELALATDFRIADKTATFGFPEVSLGILPSSGGTERLTRLVGPARAKELFLLRARFDAAEAHRLGLVAEVVAAGTALERTLELAGEVAALPRLATSITKQAIDAVPESSRAGALLVERLAYATLAQTREAQAAAEGFGSR